MRAALALLNKPGPGPILDDFPEQAPYQEGEESWKLSVELNQTSALAEVASI